MNRIDATLARLRKDTRSGLVCYFTAGDPDFVTSLELLNGLSAAGADIIELGMPFSDPVADGPTIQDAHIRARAAGQTVVRTLELVHALRATDANTALVLMGYLNPVMQYGRDRFMRDAAAAGVDGLIVVDLPVEHAAPYQAAARGSGIHLIRMTAPTSDSDRLARVLRDASGFVYHVTVTGTTGRAVWAPDDIATAVARLRTHTSVPIAAGFGIRTPEQVRQLTGIADLIVVGSRLVEVLAARGVAAALTEVGALAAAIEAGK
ncbi:tryptophan synthase subunit alpha [Telmatospirillum sp.]|uniref:tryptophan synthase subunit alpha n=1 Tax=Telmatospirillum sp. TaxID=2079197 RepID=UPI002840D388|nr:tryptophan synthase subunit alpha [Telmatospirillum sp.]MDR3438638.1 tryptophan synthase subunit alpha [Telmatospirillum sp.]